MVPSPCIVDTNVAIIANNRSNVAPTIDLLTACVSTLQDITTNGHIVLDQGGQIFQEYWGYIKHSGQPGVGDIFIKWVFNNQFNSDRCTLVTITPKDDDPSDYCEFPTHPELVSFDRSDRKFVAVAIAHGHAPPILQAADTKWIGWFDALRACGVNVIFLCEAELRAKYEAKNPWRNQR